MSHRPKAKKGYKLMRLYPSHTQARTLCSAMPSYTALVPTIMYAYVLIKWLIKCITHYTTQLTVSFAAEPSFISNIAEGSLIWSRCLALV